MPDHAVPTLPSRSLDATAAFYSRLGFVEHYRDEGWLNMNRGARAAFLIDLDGTLLRLIEN